MMYAFLSFGEISLYFLGWIAGVLYSCYRLYAERIDLLLPVQRNIFNLWGAHDSEWRTWVPFYVYMCPWLISHFIGAELVRRNNRELLPVWYILISTIFLLNFVGAFTTALIMMEIGVLFLCLLVRSRLLMWFVAVSLLIFFHSTTVQDLLPLNVSAQYVVLTAASWNLLRCISFGCDFLNSPLPWQRPSPIDFVCCLSYCLYLPMLFIGPFLLYKDFQDGLSQSFKAWTLTRIVMAVVSIVRFLFWAVVAHCILFTMDFSAIVSFPHKLVYLDSWAFYGFGYALGQFFMLKYTVFYGLACAVARLEQINAPPHPKCIARIHLYSNMWKHFDRGLYQFLVKYIYFPCLGTRPRLWKKILVSILCFAFIYVWHSIQLAVLVWTVLNFLGVTIEAAAKYIAGNTAYAKWENKMFSERGVRRFHAFLGTPMLIMAALSNFYFLGSYDVGNMFVERLQEDFFKVTNFLYLFAVCYCGCQVSIEVSNWEQQRFEAKKTKGV